MNDLNRTPERETLLQEKRDGAYFRDLARISSTLLAALIALMTFLLIVGVQTKVTGFTTELYTAIILLGVSLVLFAVGHVARESFPVALRAVRILQQTVFVGSIVAVVWFVISYAQLVIKPPETQQQGAQQGQSQGQSAPSAQQGAQTQGGPAPGETAEQHAKESQQQPGQAPAAQPGQ